MNEVLESTQKAITVLSSLRDDIQQRYDYLMSNPSYNTPYAFKLQEDVEAIDLAISALENFKIDM